MNDVRSTKVIYLLTACMVFAAVAFALPARSQSPDLTTRALADGSIFVALLIDKHELYVGESVPVVIQVGAQDDVVASLDSPPTLRGDAFALNVLTGEPEREQRVVNGKSCTLLSWHSLLAAVKPGALSLTIEAPLTVRVPAPRQPQANYADESTGDPYSDPAFQSLLQSTTAQAIVASSPAVSFQVLALPAEGRPVGFSGAVGSFKISSELSRNRVVVGEPVTLRMHVLGSGNFDRVDSAMLRNTEDWKMYRPTASFAPAENTGFRGEKLFEQAVVATQTGNRDLPALQFSYFDPETRRYEIARAAPLSIEVVPGPAGIRPLAAQISPTDGTARATAVVDSLARADHTIRAVATESLVPLYLQPRFLCVPALLIFAFGGMWFRRAHHDQAPPGPALSSQATSSEELLRQMELAATSGDSSQFFRSASRALQQAGAIDQDAEVGEMLKLVDEANYAGELPRGADLQECRRVVLRCLAARTDS